MFVGTILAFGGWIYVLFTIDPLQVNALGFVFFYFSLVLSLIGFFSLLGFGVRKIFMKKELDFRNVYVSFRQSVFISLIFVVVLLLQGQRLFTWLNVIFLIVALVALDFFILSKKSG
jgi:hypothetical protein